MSMLSDELIEIGFFPHSDLSIAWPRFIDESVSTEDGRGRIGIKYSGVPDFVYFMASKTSVDSLSSEAIEAAKRESFISFSSETHKDFCSRISQNSKFRKKLWDLSKDEKGCDNFLVKQLEYLKKKLSDCEYAGFVPPSAEYPHVDILYKDDIYLAQGKNILRLNKTLSQEVLKQTVDFYGIAVSPALRPLLEESQY